MHERGGYFEINLIFCTDDDNNTRNNTLYESITRLLCITYVTPLTSQNVSRNSTHREQTVKDTGSDFLARV